MTWKHVVVSFCCGFFVALIGLLQFGEVVGAEVMAFGAHLRQAAATVDEHDVGEQEEVVVMQAQPQKARKR